MSCEPSSLNQKFLRAALAILFSLLLAVYSAWYMSSPNGFQGSSGIDMEGPQQLAETLVEGVPSTETWQLGPQALPDDLLDPFQKSAYAILDQLGIPRNLSDSDLSEACEPVVWPCIAVPGACVSNGITTVIDGHLSPAPSACLCFLSGMAPTDIAPGSSTQLSCPFICMQALLSAFNAYLRARNGPGGQTLDCLKARHPHLLPPPHPTHPAPPRSQRLPQSISRSPLSCSQTARRRAAGAVPAVRPLQADLHAATGSASPDRFAAAAAITTRAIAIRPASAAPATAPKPTGVGCVCGKG